MGCPYIPDDVALDVPKAAGFDFYTASACTWEDAYAKAQSLCRDMGGVRVVELRIAYGGCFVAKIYKGSTRRGDVWIDAMVEVKVYDNTPYVGNLLGRKA
jgi:hypothetical protein